MNNLDIFKHWDTTPVKVNRSYRDTSYTSIEWQTRQKIDRLGDIQWENSGFESDFNKFDM